jgi:hypothetical protein
MKSFSLALPKYRFSQNNGGSRYTEQSKTNNKIILFVREEKKDGFETLALFIALVL